MSDLPDRDAVPLRNVGSYEQGMVIAAWKGERLKSRDEMDEEAVWNFLAVNVGDVWAAKLSRSLLDAAWGVADE